MAGKIKLTDICGKIGRFWLYLFLFDCAATGSGRYIAIGPFTPRIVLAVLIVLSAAIPFFADIENQIRRPVNWIVLIFMFYVVFAAFRGQAFGNDQNVLISDIKGFIYMLLIPAVPVLIRDSKQLRRAADAVIAGCFVQSVFCIVSNALFSSLAPSFYEAFVQEPWTANWGIIMSARYNAYRIFCKSSIYLIAACVLLLVRIVRAEKAKAVCGWGALFLLDAEAVIMTYTRSLYLATAAAFLLTLILCLLTAPVRKVLLRTVLLLILLIAVVYGQELVLKQGIIQYAFMRGMAFDLDAHIHIPHTWDRAGWSSGNVTEVGDEMRAETIRDLKEIIAEYPLIGKGLGATTEARGGADEYFYLDMLARMGIVGLTLYMLPILLSLIRLIKRRRALKTFPEPGSVMIGLAAFLIATYFNPWMNAALGIAWYALTVAAVWTLPKMMEGTENQCAES